MWEDRTFPSGGRRLERDGYTALGMFTPANLNITCPLNDGTFRCASSAYRCPSFHGGTIGRISERLPEP